ncbi:1-(5-phosphoribosyl)-5-[(5-phosphoribosylamino)methylideneamino]imidazole-4-carboxamide isomerase [bacterium]
MQIIPAIDIRNGNCVRLAQGKIDQETIYSKDPVFMAKLWQAKGADRLHVVDLDGAFTGNSKNIDVIKKIRSAVDMVIETGGGIRDMDTIGRYINIGIDKIILGTAAVYNPALVRQAYETYRDKIIIGIDTSKDKAAIAGWKEITSVSYKELLDKMYKIGIREFIYTEISKDGMMQGPYIEGVNKITAYKDDIKIIVSGGISNISDIKEVMNLKKKNIIGIIIGKALYAEQIKLEEAVKLVKDYAG